MELKKSYYMKSKLKFAVITPVYNRQDCIGRCIESVVGQNYNNLKHIIVNDGSTDDTLEIMLNWKKKYKNIEIKSYVRNRGINFARNRGVESIEKGYVLLLDSDDYLLSDAIVTIKNYIKKNPGYLHYMFVPDDRLPYVEQNLLCLDKVNKIRYEDWLSGRISGDFVHVIHTSVLKKFPFFEDFRAYELLNFLRFYKYTEKQLVIKEVIVGRERNRRDALSNELSLYKKDAILNEYRYLSKLFTYFGDDYRKIAPAKFQVLLKRYMVLGLALNQYEELTKYVANLNLLMLIIFKLRFGFILKICIRFYSFFKHLFFTHNL